jgi:hypothetical protein
MLLVCTNCQSRIRVPENATGKQGKCPKCGTILPIPSAEAPAPVAVEPPPPVVAAAVEPPPLVPATDYAAEPPPIPKPSRHFDQEEDRPSRRRYDDEDDLPRRRDEGPSIRRPRQSRGMSVASLILGVSGLVIVILSAGLGVFGVFGGAVMLATCGCPAGCLGVPAGFGGVALSAVLALVGLPLGFFGMSRGGRGMAITGIATGVATLLLAAALVVLTLIFGVGLAVAGANAPAHRQPFNNVPPPGRPFPNMPPPNPQPFQPPPMQPRPGFPRR